MFVIYPEKLLEDIWLPTDTSWNVWSRVTVIFDERTWPYDGSVDQSTEEPEDYLFLVAQ
jgi:hypothetical protein